MSDRREFRGLDPYPITSAAQSLRLVRVAELLELSPAEVLAIREFLTGDSDELPDIGPGSAGDPAELPDPWPCSCFYCRFAHPGPRARSLAAVAVALVDDLVAADIPVVTS